MLNNKDLKYFFRIASAEADKSRCPRTKVGCILVKDNEVLLEAHNEEISCSNQCDRIGCQREINNIMSGTNLDKCRGIHAEQKLIVKCALNAISPESGTIFITHLPCTSCAKILIEAKIKSIFYLEDYPYAQSKELFMEAKIKCERCIIGEN